MRVAMVGPFAWTPKGTVSARAFFMARELAARGHEVTLYVPPYDNPAHAGWQYERDGVRVVNMPLPSWGDSFRAKLTVPLRLAWRAARTKPDVIHVFKPSGYAGLTGLHLRQYWPRLPLVLDCDDWEGRGGWADINPYPRAWRWFFYWQEENLIRRADAVTVASQILQARAWGEGQPAERVFYLPNGPDRLLRERRVVPEEVRSQLRQELGVGLRPLALYVGHISYGSEVNLILEALPSVLNIAPEFRVVITGTGQGVPLLQKQIKSTGLSKAITLAGRVEPAALPVYLATADLALYPYRDSLVNRAKCPSKITAYMAMGKPIVATAVGEIISYLENGRAGLLIPPGNAQAFAEGIVTLLRDPARALELGLRAEQRIWALYDWAWQVTQVERAYQVALA